MSDPVATSTSDRVKALFIELSELAPTDQIEQLDRACENDAALRSAVESLLAAEQSAGEFLAGPTAGGSSLLAAERAGKPPRQQIGPYKLLQVIGEGGFGSVYLAEQTHPVHRRVALKLIKLGMDTAEIIARFEVERQALAMMDHPGIAKVFDAGATHTGRPYFVMELVRGVPITQYCRDHELDIPARLRLFSDVCGAVQHAHTKGIIHRDLKPSNVLVSTQDDRPCAKIIDFGIAKATQARLTDKTLFTEYHQFIGSPEYMSPEQAEGSLDIDTRSDVYSLGTMLYELLTGTTPIDMRELRTKTHAQIQQAIREVDPPKPSTRLSLLGPPSGARQAAAIRGELDWICMKAMEKDRARRYETAAALAADVQHFLNDEPISAARPSRAYLARKFVRRNRTLVAATVVVLAVLLAGVLATALALVGQARQRVIAERERAIAQAVAQFQTDLFTFADPARALGDKVTVLQAMNAAVAELDAGKLKDQPLVEAGVRRSIGNTLRSISQIDGAERELRRALELRLAHLPRTDNMVAQSLLDLGLIIREQNRRDEADALFREALDIRRQTLPPDSPEIASALNNVALILHDRGQFDAALPLYLEAHETNRKAFGDGKQQVAETAANIGAVQASRGQYKEAEKYLSEALSINRAVLPRNHPVVAQNLTNLSAVLMRAGRFDEALAFAREGFEINRAVLPEDHLSLALSLNNFAALLHQCGKLDEALPLFKEALDIRRRAHRSNHTDVAATLNNMGALYTDLHQDEEAERAYREALQIQRRVLPPNHPDLAWSYNMLGVLMQTQGKLAEAEPYLRDSLKIRLAALPPGHPEIATGQNNLASLLRVMGKYSEAEPLLRSAVEIWSAKIGPDAWQVGQGHLNLGRVLRALERFAESEPELLAAERIWTSAPGTPPGRHDLAVDELITLYELWDKSEGPATHASELNRWKHRQAATRPTTKP